MIQLIPSMDLLGGRIVRLRHGDRAQVTFYDLDPLAWMERLVAAGATRIHLVDLDGAFGETRQARAFAGYPTRFPGVRFQLGGGLRSRGALQEVLDLGFDAVVGTLAAERPRELVGLDPARIIAALDLKGRQVVTRGWTAESACESTDVFESLLTYGFNRALVTDVARDGTLEGPGLEALAFVAREGFQVQASGGLRDLEDLGTLAGIPNVVGAISGKALLEGRLDLAAPATRAALGGA
ncbi:MAG TPA: 1-(5-phosphoribosyl)-5-[(5-phosphoribosylamino)methylideneamino] imidazole-4-carboxamide isomerase [Holophagaceae bacterium]|nr:1-(5-phosphoribosyl)-5-[(5-phosphoribosylamino)methylideneamino] imidazole-4-carboxamide isomerase [Holophagaceae bacterium]